MEPWLPQTIWFDNLDVLGSERYQGKPGLHLDLEMDYSWRELAVRVLHEDDIPRILYYAGGFELAGYRFAAQSMRDRASSLIAFLDPAMSEEERRFVREILSIETRPIMLVVEARSFEARGYTFAGNALRDRAALLRIASRRRTPAPEIVSPWVKRAP